LSVIENISAALLFVEQLLRLSWSVYAPVTDAVKVNSDLFPHALSLYVSSVWDGSKTVINVFQLEPQVEIVYEHPAVAFSVNWSPAVTIFAMVMVSPGMVGVALLERRFPPKGHCPKVVAGAEANRNITAAAKLVILVVVIVL
jgi:hypothetical protein